MRWLSVIIILFVIGCSWKNNSRVSWGFIQVIRHIIRWRCSQWLGCLESLGHRSEVTQVILQVCKRNTSYQLCKRPTGSCGTCWILGSRILGEFRGKVGKLWEVGYRKKWQGFLESRAEKIFEKSGKIKEERKILIIRVTKKVFF